MAKPSFGDVKTKLNTAVGKTGMSGYTNINTIISNIVKVGLSAVGLLFFILVFYGGFTWMTAHGNEDKIKKSQQVVIAAGIGLIVVISAYAITTFVGGFNK